VEALAVKFRRLGQSGRNFLIQESMETFGGFHAQLLKDPIEWKNGYIIPSRRPGLGYELNESAVKRYAI
jgi:galactonate dehydratase